MPYERAAALDVRLFGIWVPLSQDVNFLLNIEASVNPGEIKPLVDFDRGVSNSF